MTPETCVRSVGAFPSRASGIRLAVTGFRHAREVEAFLRNAKWPGRHSMATATVSRLEARGAFAEMNIHLDIGVDGVGETLGLSFAVQERRRVLDIRPWTALLDDISESGLAVPEKLSALVDSSSGGETLFGRSGAFSLVRCIDHFKLVLKDERVEQVKAYVFLLMMGSRPA